MKQVLLILLTATAAASLFGQPMQTAPRVAPPSIMNSVSLDQRLGEQVPLDLVFTNEEGARVRLRDYALGKPIVLSLVYYECPMLCTEVLNGMSASFSHIPFVIGRDFEVVTVSINPRETPALAATKKAKYLQRYDHPEGAAGWHFLTGEEASIQALAASVGFRYVYDEQTKQYAHPAGIVVLTPGGVVARYLYGVEYRIKDMRFALMEASNNRVGSPVDKILLLCYQYDPVTGKYGVAIMTVMRILFILTVALLVGFIVIMVRREKKRKFSTNGHGPSPETPAFEGHSTINPN